LTGDGLLIVNADDLGYNAAHTDAVLECARRGQISSATAMMFMEDSDRAAELLGDSGIGIGLHLNLSEAFSDPGVPPEVRDTQARLVRRFGSDSRRRLHRWVYNPTIQRHVEASIRHQRERFEELYGRAPTHIDGHQHVHVCPNVLFARALPPKTKVRRVLDRHASYSSRLSRVRDARQALLNRRFTCTRWFYDISDVDPRGGPPEAAALLQRSVASPLEVMAHPGFPEERACLVSPEWEQALSGKPLGTYADLTAR
jgi:predicted glycoside hydrolase/deacetylase ChbG (UPF0249 family)